MTGIKQFDEDQAIENIMLKFWEKGYEATSMHDLENCTGLNRTSLYNAFGNKRQAFEHATHCYCESVITGMISALNNSSTAKKGVRNLLNTAVNFQFDKERPGGCLIALSVLECEQHDEDMRQILQQTVSGLKMALQKRLSKGQKQGEFPKSFDASSTATTITASISGLAILAKAGFSKSSAKKSIAQITDLLD